MWCFHFTAAAAAYSFRSCVEELLFLLLKNKFYTADIYPVGNHSLIQVSYPTVNGQVFDLMVLITLIHLYSHQNDVA